MKQGAHGKDLTATVAKVFGENGGWFCFRFGQLDLGNVSLGGLCAGDCIYYSRNCQALGAESSASQLSPFRKST